MSCSTLTYSSLRCIQVIAGVLGRAGEAGQKQRLAAAAKGNITYRPAHGLVLPEAEEDAETATNSAKSDSRSSRRDAAMEPAANEDIIDTDELAEKLDEVNNREDHRVKGGRELKASS